MAWHCLTCHKHPYLCRWCKVRHCACRPHVKKTGQHLYKVMIIRPRTGTPRTMSSRRYAHLKGAQRGGRRTAQRQNPGRFNSETARIAIRRRWDVIRRVNKLVGVRLGLPSTPRAPRVSRRHLRILYARAPRLGICYLPVTGQWVQGSAAIAEQTALRRLGHVSYARKNWVPEDDDPILNVNTGTDPAVRGGMKHKGGK